MGNLLTKSADNKAALFSGVGVVALLAYLLYEVREKKQFRQKLIESMANKPASFQ